MSLPADNASASAPDREPWLAAFFRSSTAGMAILDSDMRFLRINETLAATNGLRAEAHVGRSLHEVIPDLAPRLTPLLHRVITTGETVDVEFDGETPAAPGRVRSWRASYFPLATGAEKPFGVGVVIVETTASKAAENQIRLQASLLDQVRNAVIATDLQGRVIYANRYAETLYQWSLAEMMGRAVADLIVPSAQQNSASQIGAQLAAGQSWQGEFQVQRKDGTIFPALVVDTPLRDATGAITGCIGVSVDISAAKRDEAELRQSREQLRALAARLNLAREEETRRIAREVHDVVGQQLTALKFELQQLQCSAAAQDGVAGRHMTRIGALADRAIEATQAIATELRLGHLEIIGLGGAIAWRLTEFYRRTGITSDGAAIDELTDIDHDRAVAAYRICQEALTNVARHARATRVRVALTLESGTLVLSVADNGSGITEEEKNDPHSIGLLGMQERAQAFGGNVSIETSATGGTTVVARIPDAARTR